MAPGAARPPGVRFRAFPCGSGPIRGSSIPRFLCRCGHPGATRSPGCTVSNRRTRLRPARSCGRADGANDDPMNSPSTTSPGPSTDRPCWRSRLRSPRCSSPGGHRVLRASSSCGLPERLVRRLGRAFATGGDDGLWPSRWPSKSRGDPGASGQHLRCSVRGGRPDPLASLDGGGPASGRRRASWSPTAQIERLRRRS